MANLKCIYSAVSNMGENKTLLLPYIDRTTLLKRGVRGEMSDFFKLIQSHSNSYHYSLQLRHAEKHLRTHQHTTCCISGGRDTTSEHHIEFCATNLRYNVFTIYLLCPLCRTAINLKWLHLINVSDPVWIINHDQYNCAAAFTQRDSIEVMLDH